MENRTRDRTDCMYAGRPWHASFVTPSHRMNTRQLSKRYRHRTNGKHTETARMMTDCSSKIGSKNGMVCYVRMEKKGNPTLKHSPMQIHNSYAEPRDHDVLIIVRKRKTEGRISPIQPAMNRTRLGCPRNEQ